jgi:ElaA protein
MHIYMLQSDSPYGTRGPIPEYRILIRPPALLPYFWVMNNRFSRIYHKPFHALSPDELYAIIRLRNEVFVVEQQCVFQDADNKDLEAHHLMVFDHETLAAYARLLPPGLAYPQMSIGRVVSAPAYRHKGAGKLLMRAAIDACYELFGKGPVRIGAQLYLKKFYEAFGFAQSGEMYLEDGIEHVEMLLVASC